MAGDIGERRTGYPVDDKPVRVGKRVVVIPGVAFLVVKMTFAAGHFVHQRFAHVLFEQRAGIRMQHHGTIAFDDEEFPLNGRHHLAQGEAHRRQIEMESERSLQSPFRRNQRFIECHSRMASEVVHIGTGIVTEDTGFRLSDEPRACPGIEGFTRLRGEHLWCAKIMPLRVRQRDGGHGRH